MSTNIGVQRLDQLLSYWENMRFVHTTSEMHYEELIGGQNHKNFDAFRKIILETNENNYAKRDYEKSIPSIPGYFEKLGSHSFIPFSVLSWNMSSRRVFHLNSDIQNLLDATSIETIKWSDLKLPFDSFVITLEDPLEAKDGPIFDAISVCKIGHLLPDGVAKRSKDMWEIRMLPLGLSDCKRLSKSTRKKMIRLRLDGASDERIHELWEKHLSYDKGDNIRLPIMYFHPNECPDDKILDTFMNGTILDRSMSLRDFAISSAVHIVMNLCVYLENYPSNAQSASPNKHKSPKKKSLASNNAFVDQVSDIFKVTCQFKMQKDAITRMV